MNTGMCLGRIARGCGVWLIAGLCLAGGALAQETPAATAPPAASGGEDESLGALFIDSVRDSGWMGIGFYIMLGALSLAGVTVALERVVRLTRARLMPPAFVRQLREQLAAQKATADSLRSICQAHPSPIANVLDSALQRTGRPLLEVEKAMEDGLAKEYSRLRGSVRPLSVIANVSPLVGLYGTVVGMIIAFRIASKAGMGKAELLAEGIYLALLTTALGLTIAIPCLLVLAWLNARIDRYTHEMDDHLMASLPAFGKLEQR